MKVLIILLLFFSFIIGIPTNLGYFSLFSAEFSAPISLVKSGMMEGFRLFHWIALILSHILVLCLAFFKNTRQYRLFWFWSPLVFITVFTLFTVFAFLLLIPFIVIWLIGLYKLTFDDRMNGARATVNTNQHVA